MKSDQPGAWRVLAAGNALVGRMDEARQALRQMIRLAPNLTEDRLRVFLRDTEADRYIEGLRLAGWTS